MLRLACGQLGWTPTQFWDATIPEFFFAWRGYQERENAAFRRAGKIVAAIYNVNRDTKKDGHLTEADIFPHLKTRAERRAGDAFNTGRPVDDDEDDLSPNESDYADA